MAGGGGTDRASVVEMEPGGFPEKEIMDVEVDEVAAQVATVWASDASENS